MAGPVLAIDIGGSKCAVAIVDGVAVADGATLRARGAAPTPAGEGPAAVVATVARLARAALAEVPDAAGACGVACAGQVRDGRVWALSPDLLPGWHGFAVERAVADALALPVRALNDGHAAALGEARHGAGRGRASTLFVTVSTGIGGGLVLDGRLWRGRRGVAGPVGDGCSDPRGPVAGIGRPGVLESVASGTALARRAAALGRPADARGVLEAADAGAGWAEERVATAVDAVARALVDVQTVVAPDVVVLGGGVGLNPAFRRRLLEALSVVPETLRPEVVAAALGDAAGLVGAAAWATEPDR